MRLCTGENDDEVQVFRANHTESDHFHELFVERSSLLIGARLVCSLINFALRSRLSLDQARSFLGEGYFGMG